MLGKKRPISESSIIDQDGQLILRNLLTRGRGWLLRTEQVDGSDIHIDYACERIEDGQPSGEVVRIQLKTMRRARVSNGSIACRLPREHFRYYAERCRMPVFIVVACKDTGSAYWLFAQQYAAEVRTDPWDRRKTVTVHVPVGSNMSDNRRFTAAVAAASQYMRSLFPGTVEEALANEEKHLSAKHPGWDFKISVDEGGRKGVRLDPHSPTTGTLSLTAGKGQEGIERLRDFVTGRPVTLPRQDIDVTGLPLFAESKQTGGTVTIVSGRERPGIAWLRRKDAVCPVFGIPLKTMTQFGGLSFEQAQSNEPLRLSGVLVREGLFESPAESLSEINIQYDLSSWVGKSVRHLPYLPVLAEIARAILNRERMDLHLQIDGLSGHIASISPDAAMSMWLSTVIGGIEKANRVCGVLGTSLVMPAFNTISDLDLIVLNALDCALVSGEAVLDGIAVSTEIVEGEIASGDQLTIDDDDGLRLRVLGSQLALPQFCIQVSSVDVREEVGRKIAVASHGAVVRLVRKSV